jgi:hypothetical protein
VIKFERYLLFTEEIFSHRMKKKRKGYYYFYLRRVSKLIGFMMTFLSSANAQKDINEIVYWSETRKLNVDDFGIKRSNESTPSFAQYSISYEVNGFDFLTRNFNKKVRNYMIVSASWLDTTQNVSETLRYQQTLFNISEIYTRKFRKEIKENRKKILRGVQFVEEMNRKIMSEFSKRRISYDQETQYGTLEERQLFWEKQIAKELAELKHYALVN